MFMILETSLAIGRRLKKVIYAKFSLRLRLKTRALPKTGKDLATFAYESIQKAVYCLLSSFGTV